MVIPMICWALTGLIFFIKPGYSDAYESLTVKTYPLNQNIAIPNGANWTEARLIHSVLGGHLMVKTGGEVVHLDPSTLTEATLPDRSRLILIIEDALSQKASRYGSIDTIDDTTAVTTTGIQITLNWNALTFTQLGFDRKVIDALYKVHYLQWTPWSNVNQALGALGLLFLLLLSGLGLKVYATKEQ